MTISIDKAQITFTDTKGNIVAIVIDMLFDWVILENNTGMTNNELIDAVQAYYNNNK